MDAYCCYPYIWVGFKEIVDKRPKDGKERRKMETSGNLTKQV
jgi:hypothetical protein